MCDTTARRVIGLRCRPLGGNTHEESQVFRRRFGSSARDQHVRSTSCGRCPGAGETERQSESRNRQGLGGRRWRRAGRVPVRAVEQVHKHIAGLRSNVAKKPNKCAPYAFDGAALLYGQKKRWFVLAEGSDLRNSQCKATASLMGPQPWGDLVDFAALLGCETRLTQYQRCSGATSAQLRSLLVTGAATRSSRSCQRAGPSFRISTRPESQGS